MCRGANVEIVWWSFPRLRADPVPALATALAVALTGSGAAVTSACSSARGPAPNVVSFGTGPGLHAGLHLPSGSTGPLVILVPGGGWTSADPAGLVPLAERLAAAGFASATTSYRVGSAARFPIPLADVLCAVDTAAAQARAHGFEPSRVVVLGHSAGAQLAALAALTGARYRASCGAPSARIDGLVGLAGPYDIGRFAQVAEPLLGTTPAADAARWREANPMTWAAERSDVAAMLAYGSSDDLVPPTFSTEFAQALRAGGHRVDVQAITGATHASIYEVSVVADRVIAWVRALQPAGA